MSSNGHSLKSLSAKVVAQSALVAHELPAEVKEMLTRFQPRYPGNSVPCPKCKKTMKYIEEEDDSVCEWAPYFEYCTFPDYRQSFKFYCTKCDVIAASCPMCSTYTLGDIADKDQVDSSTVVLAKFIGAQSNNEHSTQRPRPNRLPTSEDTKDRGDDPSYYEDAPQLPDDIDSTERSIEFPYIHYYHGHENRFWAADDDMFSGCNGGDSVYWRCTNCEFVFAMRDK